MLIEYRRTPHAGLVSSHFTSTGGISYCGSLQKDGREVLRVRQVLEFPVSRSVRPGGTSTYQQPLLDRGGILLLRLSGGGLLDDASPG